jgi:hypothetical protein
VADDYAYLSSLSAHPKRPGDTSNLNPAFATPLANAIRQARAAGLNVGVESGFREPTQTGSAYDAGGNSSHTYGLAADISGLGSANSPQVQQWQKIAEANGLHNPYGIGDTAEFNHWQLPPQPLEKNPQLLASLQAAKATGNFGNVWSAYNSGGGPSRVATATPGTTVGDYYHTTMIHESGGKNIPAAGGGGAGGYWQFSPKTWSSVSAANPDLKLPDNPLAANLDQQTAAMKALTQQNVDALTKAGIPINDKNVYMAHFLGPDGATKFIGAMNQNPNASAADLFPNEAKANAGVFYANGQPRTLSQVFAAQTGNQGTGNTTGFGPNATASTGATPPGTTLTSVGGGDASKLPGFGTAAASKSFTEGLEKLAPGLAGGAGAGGQGGQGQQPQPSPILPPPEARNVAPPLAPAMEAQLTGYMPKPYGQTLNSFATPLEWGSAPPGASPYAPGLAAGANPLSVQPPATQQGAGTQMAATQPIGTSLTSLDPALYQQRLAMLYGTSSGSSPYGGGYG